MENQALIIELLKKGAVQGFNETPRLVETVISRIFIFTAAERVVKLYKRDNEHWNTKMQNISAGESRAFFINNDFNFNKFLNPKIYLDLKKISISGEKVIFENPSPADDELAIIMKTQDFSFTLTEVLPMGNLKADDYQTIGREMAAKKISLPRSFLPENNLNWYEQLRDRLDDLREWVESEKDFPKNLIEKGIAILTAGVEKNKKLFQAIGRNELSVTIDCNSENILYQNGHVCFVDAYAPKNSWRMTDLDCDLMRTGSDIYALAGKEAFSAYVLGIKQTIGDRFKTNLTDFYLLYGALIMSPYLMMLGAKDAKYNNSTKKYLQFVVELINKMSS